MIDHGAGASPGPASRTGGAGGTSAARPRVLVVDGEPQIHRLLGGALNAAGYEAAHADTGAEALKSMALAPPETVLFDLQLPDMDGKDLLSAARTFYSGPMLVLSARNRETEKIAALDLGADDYVEKPFNLGELLARLRVALRHKIRRERIEPVITAGEVEIDNIRRLVTRAGRPVRLSPNEYELLKTLAAGCGRVVTHSQLLIAAWGPAQANNTPYLRVAIGHLRRKLERDPASPSLIRTEPHVGYRFVADA